MASVGADTGGGRDAALGGARRHRQQPHGHRAGPDRMRARPRPPSADRWRRRAAPKRHMSGLTAAGLARPHVRRRQRSFLHRKVARPESHGARRQEPDAQARRSAGVPAGRQPASPLVHPGGSAATPGFGRHSARRFRRIWSAVGPASCPASSRSCAPITQRPLPARRRQEVDVAVAHLEGDAKRVGAADSRSADESRASRRWRWIASIVVRAVSGKAEREGAHANARVACRPPAPMC